MKKIVSVLICLAIVLSLGVAAMAISKPGGTGSGTGSFPIGGGNVIGGGTQMPEEVKAFIALVEAIGEVTLESKAAIEAAEAAYAAIDWEGLRISSPEKSVPQISTMRNARTQYDALVAAQEQQKPGAPETGDNAMMFVVMAALSMTCVVILISKKRAF